jgi:hypothetical protein
MEQVRTLSLNVTTDRFVFPADPRTWTPSSHAFSICRVSFETDARRQAKSVAAATRVATGK